MTADRVGEGGGVGGRRARTPADVLMDSVQWTAIQRADGTNAVEELHATHEGTLRIAGFEFKCWQLNDGQRVIDADSLEKFFATTPAVTP